MSTKRCAFCSRVLFGRADKRYCSATCRRNASRARREYLPSGRAKALIPRLERDLGPYHVAIRNAQRKAEELEEAEVEELANVLREVLGPPPPSR